MLNKYLPHILIAGFIILFVQGFFKGPEGISPEEESYRLRIHDLNQEKAILLQENTQLETKINNFKNEILQSDSIIDGSTNEQLDSMFTAYFER